MTFRSLPQYTHHSHRYLGDEPSTDREIADEHQLILRLYYAHLLSRVHRPGALQQDQDCLVLWRGSTEGTSILIGISLLEVRFCSRRALPNIDDVRTVVLQADGGCCADPKTSTLNLNVATWVIEQTYSRVSISRFMNCASFKGVHELLSIITDEAAVRVKPQLPHLLVISRIRGIDR